MRPPLLTPRATAQTLAAHPSYHSLPFAGGTIVAFPVVGFVDGVVGATGTVEIPVDGGLGAIDIYMQAIVTDASQAGGWQISNAVKAEFQP